VGGSNFALIEFDEPITTGGASDFLPSGSPVIMLLSAETRLITDATADGNIITLTLGGAAIPTDQTGTVEIAGPPGTITDQAGNEVDNQVVNLADGQAPNLSVLTVATTGADTAFAKEGDVVTITFQADEDITAPVVGDVKFFGNNADSITPVGTDGFTATRTMLTGDTPGFIPFTVDFADTSGNAGTQVSQADITTAPNVTFDEIAPTVQVLTVLTTGADTAFAKVNDVVTITFQADEDINGPLVADVQIDGNDANTLAAVGTDGFTATRTMLTGDTPGFIPFTVDFKDLAENPATQVSQAAITTATIVLASFVSI